MAKIRKNVTVFMNGCLCKVDLDEHGKVVTAKKTAPAKVEGDKPPTKQELMAELKERGVKFLATSSNAELTALIEADDAAKDAPADDEEKKEGSGGTGDRDVI